jgi:hypothetical protein
MIALSPHYIASRAKPASEIQEKDLLTTKISALNTAAVFLRFSYVNEPALTVWNQQPIATEPSQGSCEHIVFTCAATLVGRTGRSSIWTNGAFC